MPDRSARIRFVVVPLAGAAVLAAYSLVRLPAAAWRLERPRTPFDLSEASMVAPGYALVRAAAAQVPEGASVVVLTEPREPTQETWYHRFAVGLLPGRRALPASFYGRAAPPEIWGSAEFVVVVGARPDPAPGRLLLETPDGTVWKSTAP